MAVLVKIREHLIYHKNVTKIVHPDAPAIMRPLFDSNCKNKPSTPCLGRRRLHRYNNGVNVCVGRQGCIGVQQERTEMQTAVHVQP